MNFSVHVDSNGNKYIQCPKCGLKSHNPNDIAQGYCARCFEQEKSK